jgi:hypothetical protein
MQSGRAIKQTHFRKLRTVLSGQGWDPMGLDDLDYADSLLLRCATPRSIGSRQPQFTLVGNRRSDPGFEPQGYALLAGYLVPTALQIKGDIAQLQKVQGALSYQVHYYPEIWVFAEPPQVQGNITDATFSWSLTCEEV